MPAFNAQHDVKRLLTEFGRGVWERGVRGTRGRARQAGQPEKASQTGRADMTAERDSNVTHMFIFPNHVISGRTSRPGQAGKELPAGHERLNTYLV